MNGVTYTIRRTVRFGFESPTPEAPNFTNTFLTTVRTVTPGPDNFVIHFRFHITVLPNGEVATVFEGESAECRVERPGLAVAALHEGPGYFPRPFSRRG